MLKKRTLYISILVTILTLISFYFDKLIIQGFSLIRNSFLNKILLIFTWITSEIVIAILLTILLFSFVKNRKWIVPLWATFILSAIVSITLKIITQRQRPFQQAILATLPALAKISHFSWNLSFPSFNTMIMFCTLPILSKLYPKLRRTWLILAILVGFTRIYFGLHFMSDVLAGGLIGYLIGLWVIDLKTRKEFFDKFIEKVKSFFKRFI